jgi:uncharacterized membrane protein
MECVTGGTADQFASITRRNNSMTAAGRAFVFGVAFAVSIGIALGFTLICGAWPVLPFAGAEMLVLFLAFRHIDRHAADYERVTLEGDQLNVEVLDGGRMARYGFNRFWTQVICAGDGSRLALRSHGREFEIGRHINQEQRLELARQLRRRLRATG